MTPSRITWFIRKWFKGRIADDSTKWSSHSCKATTLSWASKHGLEESLRLTLGFHGDTLDRCSQIYGREPLSFPVGQLCRIMEEIRRGIFEPDAAAHRRFRGKAWPDKRDREGLDKLFGPLQAQKALVITEPKFVPEEDSDGEPESDDEAETVSVGEAQEASGIKYDSKWEDPQEETHMGDSTGNLLCQVDFPGVNTRCGKVKLSICPKEASVTCTACLRKRMQLLKA